ncbi:MAG: TrmJ/YjtD family RNA methyltransferase [Sulfolobales archaeon]
MISKKIRVVLVGVEGSINLGFVARLCKNFGVEELYLVKPEASIGEEALRYAVKGAEVLAKAVVVDDLKKAFEGVELVACTSSIVPLDRDLLRQPIELKRFVELIKGYESIALVFGRESTGLTREELAECDLYVHIAADREYPVLNLSHAVAIALYEIHSAYAGESSIKNLETPSPEDFRLAERYLSEITDLIFKNRMRSEEVKTTLRRILRKSDLTKTEINILIKILSKISALIKKIPEEIGEK